jgi:Fe-S cluster assembly scaffold protein SufB
MNNRNSSKEEIYRALHMSDAVLKDEKTAHIVINHNQVLGTHLVPGLTAEAEETSGGISLLFRIKEGHRIDRPVHLCFGMTPEQGLQEIIMRVEIEPGSHVAVQAHCAFPNAVEVIHKMDAEIKVMEGASYSYRETHLHGPHGGVNVIPKSRISLMPHASFRTDFDLLQGRVGKIDIDYETTCYEESLLEMNARINGLGDDDIIIRETGHLIGRGARGVLTSRIAVRDNAKAAVHNRLTASAPYARGHVDCKEIIQGNGKATAVPIVEVSHAGPFDPRGSHRSVDTSS